MQTNSRFFEKAEMRHEDSLMANRIHLLSKSVEELEEQYDERLLAIALLPPLRDRRIDNDEVDGGNDDDFDSLKGAAREAQWRRRQKPLDSLSSGEDTPPPRSATFGRLSVQQRDVMKSRSMEFSAGVRRGVVLVGGSPTLPARVGGRKSMSEAIPPRVRKCNTCNETELLAVMNDAGILKGKRNSSGSLSQSSSQEEAATCGGGDDACPPNKNEDPSDHVSPLKKNPLLAVPPHLMEKGVVKSKSVELRPYGRLQSVPASGSATLKPQSRRNAASTLLPTSGLRGGPSPNKYSKVMSLGRNLDSSELDMYSGSEGNLSKSYSLEDGLAETGKEHGKKGWLKRLFSRSAAKFKADV